MMRDAPAAATTSAGLAQGIGYALAALAAVLFSTKAIVIKATYAHGVDAETLLALRMLLSMPVYAVLGLWHWRRARPAAFTAGDVARAALVGVLGYWVASYTDFLGLKQISASFERLILFTYPLFVVVLGAIFFGGRLKAAHFVAFAVAYAGLALVFLKHPAEAGGDIWVGTAWVIIAAITFALYQLLAHGQIRRWGAELFTCIGMTGASAATLAWFFTGHGLADLAVSAPVLRGGLLLALLATIIPTFAMSAALARISAQANSTIAMISPVATILMADVFLGEHLSAIEWLGAALVVASVALFVVSDRRK